MGSTYDFSSFSKQSSKGIVIIYVNLLYKIFKTTWVLLIILLRQFLKLSDSDTQLVYLGIVVVLVLLFIRAIFVFKNFQFKIENKHFVLKQGILKKTNTSISFDRIQNINFKQSLIQQLINVYEVSIETAGSKKTEIAIKALQYDKAQALKKQISISEKLHEEQYETSQTPLLKIGFKELLKVSLTENHLQSLLIFVALLIGVYQQIKDIFKSLGKKEYFDSYLNEGTNAVYENIALFLVLLIVLLFVAVISSFVRILFKHFNLSVFVKNQSFEINQGLTTKKSVILKKEKIQTITVSTNPIKRKLGISFVTFKQAVSGRVTKKKNKLIRIVGCKKIQLVSIKELLFGDNGIESEKKEHSDSYFKVRMYFRSSIVLAVFNLVLFLNVDEVTPFFSNLILIPLMIVLIKLKFNKTFFKMNSDMMLIGKGRVETHHIFLPFYKVQNIKIKQTLFQQRKKVVDLIFQTASGKVKIPCIKKEKAMAIYNYTLYQVESNTKSWM